MKSFTDTVKRMKPKKLRNWEKFQKGTRKKKNLALLPPTHAIIQPLKISNEKSGGWWGKKKKTIKNN